MYKDQLLLCQHLYGAVLRSGNHLDKIGEIGLKRHKSFTSSENKEAKKLSDFRTTLRNNSKTLERCENNLALFDENKGNTFLMPELC